MTVCKGILKPINTRRKNIGTTEVEPLSPFSRMFHAPMTNCVIVAMFGFKTRIDVEAFKYGLKSTLLKHPRFSSKLVFDAKDTTKPVGWIRTVVNIDDHIVIPNLDFYTSSSEQLIKEYTSNISKTTMDLSKPLWEFHVLNIETSEAVSTGIFLFHHSLGDGISLISILLACARNVSDPNALPNLPVAKKKTRSYTGLLGYFFAFLLILRVLWNTLVDAAMLIATMIYLQDTKTPLKVPNRVEQNKPKRFIHKILSIDDIKLVKNAMGMTVNDVILGIIQSGVTRYLNGKYGMNNEEDRPPKNNLPKHIRLRALIPMNLRATAKIEGLAEKMEANSTVGWEWGNKIGTVLVPLHIKLSEDPLDYFRKAKAIMDQQKLSFQGWLSYFTNKLVLNVLGVKVASRLFSKVASNITLGISNVPGPMEEISLYGHPVAFIAPSVYGITEAPLVFHFQSYMDKMTMVCAVEEDIMPDLYELCEEIEKSLMLAKSCVIEKKSIELEHIP